MKSRKYRNGSKKWKKNGHKTREWYINQYMALMEFQSGIEMAESGDKE